MKPEENPADPSFWEALGITAIVLDDTTPESFQIGMDQLAKMIEAKVTMIHLKSQLKDE